LRGKKKSKKKIICVKGGGYLYVNEYGWEGGGYLNVGRIECYLNVVRIYGRIVREKLTGA
jgi:hypothetical protein